MAQVTGAISVWPVLIFYAAVICLAMLCRRLPRYAAALILLLLITAFSFVPTKEQSSTLQGDITEIVFVDVGQGDCALIITPDDYTLLLDGGGNMWSSGDVGEYSVLPYLKSRGIDHIDVMINSHPDADHADGLISVLQYLEVERLVVGDIWQGHGMWETLYAAARQNNSEILDMRGGDSMELGEYIDIHYYSPSADMGILSEEGDTNNNSLICEISCGEIDILFSGDMDGDVLAALCREYGAEAELIKVPHHGSNTGYHEELADILSTHAAVISVGKDNSYGHPTEKVVEYWQENGAVYRTDTDGSVTVYTNGTEYEIVTYY